MHLDPAQFLAVLWRRRLSAVVAFIAVTAGAFSILTFAAPRYDTFSLVLIGSDVSLRNAAPSDKALEEDISSIVAVANTDDVLREAADRVGLDRIFPDQALLETASEGATTIDPVKARTDVYLPALRRSLSIKPLAKTRLISIDFGNSDPKVAAEFTNAVAQAMINREIELWRRPGAVDFYRSQQVRFEADIKTAATSLASFVSVSAIYSVKQQQDLLLRRASDLKVALSLTRGLLAQKNAQKLAVGEQLNQIKPAPGSKLESKYLGLFGGISSHGSNDDSGSTQTGSETLPLSLERVYRDGFSSLGNLNSEVSGLEQLLKSQVSELSEINGQLLELASNAAEFDRLEQAVETATKNAEIFNRKVVDEQIDRDLANAKMSSLRVVQTAAIPKKPAFPSKRVMIPAGLAAGLVAALAAALLAEIVNTMIDHRTRWAKVLGSENDKGRHAGLVERQSF